MDGNDSPPLAEIDNEIAREEETYDTLSDPWELERSLWRLDRLRKRRAALVEATNATSN